MPVRSTTGSDGDYAAGKSAASGVQNGGTVINAGSNAAGIMTRNLTLTEIADNFGGVIGSKVLENDGTGSQYSDRAGVAKAVSGGTLAYNAPADEWVIRGVSATIGGVSNDVLLSKGTKGVGHMDYASSGTLNGGVVANRKIGTTPTIDLLAAPASGLNSFFTKGAGAGNVNTFINPADGTAAVSSEIFPTRAVPGELTYNFGAANPTTDEYKAKDSYEDESDTSS